MGTCRSLIVQANDTNESYFSILSEENASVLRQLIKQQIHKLNVVWSFEWFQYIKNYPENDWDYNQMCGNPNVTWE